MKAKISELKARLSAYLDAVRRGETVIVLDRKTPVARLVPIEREGEGWEVDQASRPPRDIGDVRGVRPKKPIDVVQVLAETRGDH